MNPESQAGAKESQEEKKKEPRKRGWVLIGGPVSRSRQGFPKLRQQDPQAKRVAAAILEVLGGMRRPQDAAEVLGVSLPRYYALEQRALGGLVEACGRRSRGRGKAPECEVASLRREVQRQERECARSQALLRAAQKVVGLVPAPSAKAEGSEKKKRRRRPVARALRAASVLRSGPEGKAVEKGGVPGDDGSAVKE